jgi:hypothetical protein
LACSLFGTRAFEGEVGVRRVFVGDEFDEPPWLGIAAFCSPCARQGFQAVGEQRSPPDGNSTSPKEYVARCLVGEYVPFRLIGDQSRSNMASN